ncbi:MAG TPA: DUF2752 domain-containing protein [Nocardioidaceae bacterium]|nr:DUF2752 domain-containing protein [Nocardioidaceae bacterium]
MRSPLVVAGAVGAATVALHVRDPHASGSWGICPLFAATGIYCPGCGGLRAVNDLTNADLLGAASSNLLFVASIPVLAFLWARWFGRSWQGRPAMPGRERSQYLLAAVVVAVLLVFTVVRNLPFGSWLAP